MTVAFDAARADEVCTSIESWLIALVPVALVTVSGVADVLCSVVAIMFVVRAAVRRDWAWASRPWVTTILLLWLYLCIRSSVAIRPLASVGDALAWLRYPIFAIAVSHALRHDVSRQRLITAAVWSVLFLAVDAILQYSVGYDITGHPRDPDMRLTGPFGRPRVGITIAWLFLPPLLALVEQRRWRLAGAVGGSAILAIVLSGERMSLMTLGLDAAGLLILLPQWRRQILAVVGIGAALMIAVLIVRPSLYERQVNSTLQVVSAIDQSPYGVLWNGGLSIASEYPAFGVGMRNYRIVCPEPQFGPLRSPRDYPRCSTHPHNYYLEWLIAGGVPALAGFLLAMGLLLRDLLVYGDRRSVLFAGLVATILVRLWPVASTTSFFLAWSAIPLFLMIGWALSYLPEQRRAPRVQLARQ